MSFPRPPTRPPPATPEVISSLIEQLAAISAPPAHVYSSVRSSKSLLADSPCDADPDAGADLDVCEPPVVRTSKPPSGRSPVTAALRSPRKPGPLGAYLGRSRSVGSAASLGSCHSGRSEASVGALSIEGMVVRPVAGAESARSSAESRRSVKRPRSLMYMSSRERLRGKDEAFRGGDTICEEPVARDAAEDDAREEAKDDADTKPSRTASPARRIRMNLVDRPELLQPTVPDRGSSLRHASPTKKSRRDKGKEKRDKGKQNSDPVPDPDPDEQHRLKILDELEQEENEVAQRIKQLREQKLRRDMAADARSADARSPDSDAAPEKPNPRADINTHLRPPTRPAPPPPLRHSRHRSLTVNDGDDLPLPINYALALKTLDTSAPTSPRSPRVDATLASPAADSPNTDRLKRASSLSVGGRSAYARKANSALISAPTHKHSSSLTDRPPTFRSASEDMSSGRHSSLSTASAANSFTLQHKKTLKKKRWSHPDLPAKAEKAHNDRLDRQDAEALRRSHYPANPWSPVIEERPSSLDSIDGDVDAFLAAPRLSQRLRHPQTGRLISFSEVGDPNGFAVFVCVGMGLTRFVMAFYDQLAATLKLRLITPERPGIGASQADPTGTPLTWPDDVALICQALGITKFSLLAHSAGAIYALATSLRMPQHIRGRVHLLAPWIPPSQMAPIGLGRDSPPTQQLPRSQRFLRALPPSLLRVANATFLSNTSASLQRTQPKPKPRRPRTDTPPPRPSLKDPRDSMLAMDQVLPSASTLSLALSPTTASHRARAFDERLTFAIWDRATLHANPATDLIVCLETKQPIGFRYEDINRPVVIHHGTKDSRVPVDNVRWLGRVMRKCEVRVLDGEHHGLMGSAKVMGEVLMEMAADWEDWTAVVRQAEEARQGEARRSRA